MEQSCVHLVVSLYFGVRTDHTLYSLTSYLFKINTTKEIAADEILAIDLNLAVLRSSVQPVVITRMVILRQGRNALQPVSRLPTETLCEIMASCVASECQTRPWLVLSQICTRWRNIALGYPVLWTVLDLSHPELTRMVR